MAETPDSSSETANPDPDDAADSGEIPCYCPLGGVMDLLSRRYSMQLICVVAAVGPARYGEIAEAFGDASSSTLSTRLDEFVEAGYLAREQYAEIPPRVEYELTPAGEELAERLEPLLEWANEYDTPPNDLD